MLVHAILTDSARLCAARVEFAFRTFTIASPAQLALCVDALQKIGGTDAHELDKVGVLNKVGRKRGFRKDLSFPVAGPLGGASTPVRRNGTGPSRGKARRGYTSPIPAEIDWMRWVYLGRGPLVSPIEEKVSSSVLFRKVRVSGGVGMIELSQPPLPFGASVNVQKDPGWCYFRYPRPAPPLPWVSGTS